jgi:peptide/nickel transport system permease protein
MLFFLLRRFFQAVLLLVGISLMSFIVIHLAPGKPSDVAGDLNPKVSLEVRQRLEKLYGLDQPLGTQYLRWLRRLARWDFGDSFSDGRPVTHKIQEALPVTLAINVASLILLLGIGIPLGAWSALHEDSRADKILTAILFLLFAMPTFWLSLVLMDLLAVKAKIFAVSGLTSLDFEYFSTLQKSVDILKHLALPIFVSTVASLAAVSRYMRQSLREELRKSYIAAAYARGLPPRVVLFRHGLRNALLPIITLVGLSIPGLIGGSVIFESIFASPGTGRLFFSAVMARDYPVIMALLVLSAALTLLGNFLADVGYALADPRIRLAKER